MNRRTLISLLAVSLCALALSAWAQNRFAGVEIKSQKVAGNVYMLEGRGGNIGVSAGADGVVMIDSQFAPLAEKIAAAVKDLGGGELRFLLNTHHHGDHVGGNEAFGVEAAIVAHENVLKRLVADERPRGALPVLTFRDEVKLHLNGEEIHVLHLPPGHTDGDSIVFFTGSKVVHMGDHFFSGRFPYIDVGGGGDVAGFIRNVETALAKITPDMKIIPGHGPLSTRKDLEVFHGMLKETVAVIQRQVAAGKTLEEAQKEGLDSKWDSWGEGFIDTNRWIEIVFKSLAP